MTGVSEAGTGAAHPPQVLAFRGKHFTHKQCVAQPIGDVVVGDFSIQDKRAIVVSVDRGLRGTGNTRVAGCIVADSGR